MGFQVKALPATAVVVGETFCIAFTNHSSQRRHGPNSTYSAVSIYEYIWIQCCLLSHGAFSTQTSNILHCYAWSHFEEVKILFQNVEPVSVDNNRFVVLPQRFHHLQSAA